MVRVVRPQMGTVDCVTAMSLPYETNETNDKDIVFVHTHYSKELQEM